MPFGGKIHLIEKAARSGGPVGIASRPGPRFCLTGSCSSDIGFLVREQRCSRGCALKHQFTKRIFPGRRPGSLVRLVLFPIFQWRGSFFN